MSLIASVRRMFETLWRDTNGVILPYVTLLLVVIIGLSVLALDGARYLSLQTQLQNAADALALAGARELDLTPGSKDRAIKAINNLVKNHLAGMDITAPVTVKTIHFYKSLPAASAGWPTKANLAVQPDDSDAKFVAVTVGPARAVSTILPVTFFGGTKNSFTTNAQAIAGNAGQQICKVPPVFICNPYQTAGMTDAQATAALENAIQPDTVGIRKEIKVLNDGQTGPGHFGWLIPPDGCTGAACLEKWIAEDSPGACYKAGGVDLNTGAMNGVLPGFNVRFDIPCTSCGVSYSPDVNVRKGYVAGASGNWCNASPDTGTGSNQAAMGLPEDTAFSSLSAGGGSIGNGQWDCIDYWKFNHNGIAAPAVRADGTSGVCGTPTTTTLSRYDVYEYEIKHGLVSNWSRGTLSNNWAAPPPYSKNTGENGQPLCSGASTGKAGRRVIYMAVINCMTQSIPNGATANNIPTAGFASFFLTEPVLTTGPAANRNLVGEMIGFADMNGGGVGLKATVFNDVQLYR